MKSPIGPALEIPILSVTLLTQNLSAHIHPGTGISINILFDM